MNYSVTLICVIFGLISTLSLATTMNEEETYGRSKRSTEDPTYFYYQSPKYPRDCQEVYDQCGESSPESGVYTIQPEGADEPFNVYCNNSIDGGGWTVIQRRVDGSVEFYRNWTEYKNGFGFLTRAFWLGNDKMSLLTNQKDYMLRIDLSNRHGDPYFAKYDLFRISDEATKYRLVGLGDYDSSSTTGVDGMANHRNQSFTTMDRDNDRDDIDNRAEHCSGAWWFNDGACCYAGGSSHLNGLFTAGATRVKSICWFGLPRGGGVTLTYSEMKIRPV